MKKISVLILTILLCTACSKNEEDTSCFTYAYSLKSGEKAGTVDPNLEGTHKLEVIIERENAPFKKGTKGTFTVKNNVLTVEIEGEKCIILKNPTGTKGVSEVTFIDDSRDNLVYGVSLNDSGIEINVGALDRTFYNQFK